jgi:transposase
MLVTEMPELGRLDPKSLAGLGPRARQSGQWTGKAFVQSGRKQIRQALYMPALVALRFNPDLKAKYQQLLTAGKAPKKAITAMIRKLIVLANPRLKAGRPWGPTLA